MLTLCVLGLLTACGAGVAHPSDNVSSAMTVGQALAATPEMLELEPVSARQALYREVTRNAPSAANGSEQVLFPIIQNGQLHAATATTADLFSVPDAGEGAALVFSAQSMERWPEDRRESLLGLSEREAAEMVARSLLNAWGIHSAVGIRVDRAVGAPYAVAYADGVMRVNPSFLCLAASTGLRSRAPVTF